MFAEQNCSDNQRDEKSQSVVNCHKKRSFAPKACGRRKQLRKCKSEANVGRRHSEINRMGTTISRSKSFDNIESDSFVYETLTKRNKSLCSFGDSDEDYKLLESTENDDSDSGGDDSGCVTQTINLDGHDTTENNSPISASNNSFNDCIQQTPRAGNEMTCDLLCKKSSTLPRFNFEKGSVDRDQFSRCSVPYRSFDSRAHCSKEVLSDFRVVSDDKSEALETAEIIKFSEVPVRSDKQNSVTSSPSPTFRSTTLPKTRSRKSEPFSRRSLRQAIDLAVPRKHLGISDALEHNGAIIPAEGRMNAVTGMDLNYKVKRTRSNLSWLRKSMRKLNPFQMPQITSENQPQTAPIASTSETSPCDDCLSDKNVLSLHDSIHELQTRNDESRVMSPCASNPDLFNIVLTEQQQNSDLSRPRQYGRRSNPVRITSFQIDATDNCARIIAHHQQERRPASAPVAVERLPSTHSTHRSRACLPSEPSSLATSRNSSPVSVASSTGSSSVADPITEAEVRPRFVARDDDDDAGENGESSKTWWPHSLSRPICCLFSTLGLFNISRFAVFSVHFGANFLVQFLILSFLFGVPLLWLQMVLGQKIKGGIVTMYRITPICKGIGVALMISHCVISLYSSVSVAWLLIYLRDSVISSKANYIWEQRFGTYRGYQNNTALKLTENIADYFNGVVLQRLSSSAHEGKMRFQLAFSVAIVWTLVFILLCRGIRSLGQIVIGIAIFCFLGLSAVCIKFLTLLSFETVQDIFPATDWQEFFANSNSWSVAAQEAFLTWGLLGVSVYSLYCKTGKNQRLNPHLLRREALLVVFLTLFGLVLGAILGSTCIIILKLNGFNYYPASFENPKNDIFMWPAQVSSLPTLHHSIPQKWITRYSNVIGESFERPIFVNQQGIQMYKESGYKTLRLVTEMLPATLAISSRIEPVWGIIAFLTLFLFGLAQLGIMWKPISGAIGNSTSAILLSCVTGLFLGFPLTTDNGIIILHFMDFVFGGSWWLLILWTSYIIAIFMVRGRPFTSDVLVKELKFTETLSAFLAFSWNVLLPVALILLSVMEYKKSYSNELFHQRNIPSLNHLANWPMWVKQLGGFLQLSLLIVVPCVALVQIYIYLSKGPRDILERIELLFRPPMEDPSNNHHLPIRRLCQPNLNQPQPVIVPLHRNDTLEVNNDAPPKYSPPPSYSRAVGLRVAKALRNSIRRSVRRFRRNDEPRIESVEANAQNIPTISSSIPDSSQTLAQSLRINSQTVNRNINEFLRSTIHGTNRNSQSTDNLMLSDMSLNVGSPDNRTSNRNNAMGNLI